MTQLAAWYVCLLPSRLLHTLPCSIASRHVTMPELIFGILCACNKRWLLHLRYRYSAVFYVTESWKVMVSIRKFPVLISAVSRLFWRMRLKGFPKCIMINGAIAPSPKLGRLQSTFLHYCLNPVVSIHTTCSNVNECLHFTRPVYLRIPQDSYKETYYFPKNMKLSVSLMDTHSPLSVGDNSLDLNVSCG